MADSKNLYEALRTVQIELKAPKGQRNSFGNYNYRSCEDILEAVKPLLAANGLTLVVTDQVKNIGERYYVEAEATVTDSTDAVTAYGFAREEEDKKGMDGSQITGAASSYARKYALNGLFLIDDTKDADTDEHRKTTSAPAKPAPKAPEPTPEEHVKKVFGKTEGIKLLTPAQSARIYKLGRQLGYETAALEKRVSELTSEAEGNDAIATLEAQLKQEEGDGSSN